FRSRSPDRTLRHAGRCDELREPARPSARTLLVRHQSCGSRPGPCRHDCRRRVGQRHAAAHRPGRVAVRRDRAVGAGALSWRVRLPAVLQGKAGIRAVTLFGRRHHTAALQAIDRARIGMAVAPDVMQDSNDVIVIGAGLAGLVAATEIANAGKRVLILDQEPEQSLGGQAFWSFGGLFFVNSPEQRHMGIRDSPALALSDWVGTEGVSPDVDRWPRRWAEAYVDFAGGEKRAWLHAMGMRWFPVVGWAERGGYGYVGQAKYVPRLHVSG